MQRPPEVQLPAGVLAKEAFEEALFHERARADRAPSSFSLVIFRVAGAAGSADRVLAERVLAHVLLKRTRSIDIKGVYGNGLGLILPYTASTDVDVVWDNVLEGYRRRVMAESAGAAPPELSCEVYAYPSNERTKTFTDAARRT